MIPETDTAFSAALLRLADDPADASALAVVREAADVGQIGGVEPVDETTAVLVWYGDPGSIPQLVADHTGWLPQPGITHPDLPGLAWWVVRTLPKARIEYAFADDGGFMHADPRNPWVVHNGFGPMSELRMPGYERHPAVEAFRTGEKGTAEGMIEMRLPSNRLGYEVTVYLDMPETHASAQSDRFPLLLFNDGLDYVEFAQAPTVVRWLQNRGEIPRTACAYVCPPNRHVVGTPNRTTEYGMNPDYAAFLAQELVPALEAKYPVGGHRCRRAVVGDSYGGLCALYSALTHPEVFGGAYSQSGYVGFRGDAIFPLVQQKGRELALCFDVGEYERMVGASFLNPAELDFTLANLRLRDLLERESIPHHFDIQPQGHTWGFWRDGLLKTLPVLLRFMSPLC